MTGMFWITGDDLDADQAKAVEGIPEAQSFLLYGPAGSGKTNILLLRAKWLTYRKKTNFKIIAFTASLKRFIAQGCTHYGFDPASAVTQMTFFKEILDEFGVHYELTRSFEPDRTMLAGKVLSLIESKGIDGTYCETLLVDEAQDYTDTELLVFRRLAKTLVLAMDSRQSIYRTTHTPDLPEKLVGGQVITLQYHYRSGLKLCKVADAILSDAAAFPKIQGECKYPESTRPSQVVSATYPSLDAQLSAIAANVAMQIDLYPEEKIGILFPKKDQSTAFEDYLSANPIAGANEVVYIDTLHGSKGWEFRAVHIAGLEALYKMGATQKRLIYTGLLRGKTSAHIYFSGHLPGYLDSALGKLEPPRPMPTLSDLFKST
ncbi:AAA family ATPase [Roseateles sp. PN1]|uniref:AAA family ATPase n=1 Tax=Roseateles sp. PN1 TaxID=3137372 RepID=UPI00313A293C